MPAGFDAPVVCPSHIGRDEQVAALRKLATRVADRFGQMVLVGGEAGIGKTRLVREFGEELRAEHWIVLQGACFECDRLLPYAPLLDALGTMLTTIPPSDIERCLGPAQVDLARLLPELGVSRASDSAVDPPQEKHRIFHAFEGVFSRLAAKQPLLLVLEDLHWADDSSLEFLPGLARSVARAPILILGTYRDIEVPARLSAVLEELDRSRSCIELRLTGLGRDEVGAMLQAIFRLERPIRQDFLQAIWMLTEGNPFFIEELLRSVVGTRDVADRDDDWDRGPMSELRLPRTLQDAVRRRTDRLSVAARSVLLLAAVSGRRFEFELLQSLTARAEAELLALMKELVAAQLLVEVDDRGDQFAFRHALTHQAVYGQLLGRERRALHRRVGETIERSCGATPEPRLEDLAYHFSEGGDWAKALLYAERAAERADALHAPAGAVEQYTRAIEAARSQGIPPLPRLYRGRGLAYERLGTFDRARADHETALVAARAAGDQATEWQALLDLGFLWAGRAYEQTRTYFAEALDLARTLDDPPALGHSLNRVGNWLVNVDLPAEGERYHREALAIFQHLDDDRGIAETLDLLGLAEYMQGNVVEAVGYLDQAIVLFRVMDDRASLTSALSHRGVTVTTYHSFTAVAQPALTDEAIRAVEEARHIAHELGWRASEAFARMVLALVLGPRGEYVRAIAEAEAALHTSREIDHRQWICASRYTLGEIHRDVFDLDEAGRQFQHALALARELGSGNWTTVTTGALASTLLARGDNASAARLLEASLTDDETPATLGQRQVRLAQAELALHDGDATLALRRIDSLPEHAPRVRLVGARALRVLGRLGEAEATLLGACEIAAACKLPGLTWRLRAELASVLDAQGRAAEAAAARAESAAIVDELASKLPDAQLIAGFIAGARREIGLPARARLGGVHGPGGLTPRERQVAVLIAEGRSNRAMAELLVLSERTVEDHVSRILGKLGFSSRSQIASWATEQGLRTSAPR